jgi:hypothetical protein
MADLDAIRRQRAAARARQRRRRIIITVVIAAAIVAALVGGYMALWPKSPSAWSDEAAAKPTDSATQAAGPSASPSPTADVSPAPESPSRDRTSTEPAPRLHIVADFIPFGASRRREMAAYSQRHYGDSSCTLHPRAVVLHYTAGGTAAGVHGLFAADKPNVGELPGVVTHFIVDKDGTIYQELPTSLRGRHTIGLNHIAIGIEFVQDGGSGSSWADRQIINRKAQLTAGLELVAWLQQEFDIADRDVVGHATANGSRYFKDLQGWRNTHTDWLAADVAVFRKHLRELRGE